jgi:16S rRNA (adenine1518-N6/adenine1519-N6)-dimethyltransferase
VDSAIVRLDLEPERRARIEDRGRFHDFVRAVFCHRRKVLRGVLARMAAGRDKDAGRRLVEDLFAALMLPPEVRAEDIPPDEFVGLEQAFAAAVSAAENSP